MITCAQCGTYVDVTFYPDVGIALCSNCAWRSGNATDDVAVSDVDTSWTTAVDNFETDEDTDW